MKPDITASANLEEIADKLIGNFQWINNAHPVPIGEARKLIIHSLQSALTPVQADAALALERIRDLEEQREALQAELEQAKAFKDFVHRRLDSDGVPKEFPNGDHTKEGCRIGDRLDWVLERAAELEQAKQESVKMTTEMRAMRGHWDDISAALGVKGDEDYYNAPVDHAADLQSCLTQAEAARRDMAQKLEKAETELMNWRAGKTFDGQSFAAQAKP